MFGKKTKDEDIDAIEIISRTQPMMCGGTDAYRDNRAPKEIVSKDMILFDVTSSFSTIVLPPQYDLRDRLWYISAYAIRGSTAAFPRAAF